MGSIKTAMVVLWLTFFLFLAVGSSVLKNQVQGLERRLATINNNIQKDISIMIVRWLVELIFVYHWFSISSFMSIYCPLRS